MSSSPLVEAHLFYTLLDDEKHRMAKKQRYGSFLADLRDSVTAPA